MKDGKEEIVYYFGGKKVGLYIYVKSIVIVFIGWFNSVVLDDLFKYGIYKYKIYNLVFLYEFIVD